jgi:hypothetical protein
LLRTLCTFWWDLPNLSQFLIKFILSFLFLWENHTEFSYSTKWWTLILTFLRWKSKSKHELLEWLVEIHWLLKNKRKRINNLDSSSKWLEDAWVSCRCILARWEMSTKHT